jgi:cyanophycin synthetase
MQKFITADNFVVYLDNQQIVIKTLNEEHCLNNITQIPITVHGLAHYNYENVLHATALTFALGLTPTQIMFGLAKFGADARSNFGRWNYYHSKQAGHLVVDIAHNPAGLINILDLAQGFRKLHGLNGRLGLMYGNTADRKETIPDVVKIILEHKVDLVVIKEFQESLRGSVLGEMPELFRLELLKQGYPKAQIKVIPNELEATEYILAQAQPDDMYLLCSHELLTDVSKFLRERVAAEKNT